MLPHVAKRPLALVRCPEGVSGECFFQKHASPGFPDALHRVTLEEKSGSGEYLFIRDAAGLVAAVQMGVVELHIWGAGVADPERPDRLVFDLDPDPGLDFVHVKKAAAQLREELSRSGLKSFLLATGGKGLHVVVPLLPGHSWDTHAAFAERFARYMAERNPERYTTSLSKAKRRGKVFIDHLRNRRGSTAIVPFSPRARAGAPVAMPLSWPALGPLRRSATASVATAAARLKRMRRDPWQGYFELRQTLPLSLFGRGV
ncbi:MAG: DNA polymerase domain-containing protein [Alphaproteobacteria bacterium]|nr:MAG: DNA polymerase domain-containing protein [Alphaproteobacteria bacterium]